MLWLCVGWVLAAEPSEDVTQWEQTLDRVSQAVVSVKVTATRDFDTEGASVSQGTGFVVDFDRGLLLTNRHMVHAGPVVAEGVLLNHTEIDLWPVYRDPVHDFGFYRFDPDEVRNMQAGELALNAEGARVGLDIRVIGNDAGEKLSILDGTLARVDRNAPNYGSDNYNDFNTFYYQAASNTSGGSSGSPVVDINGDVVALNAGGNTGAASSFYLPLHRVVRALDLLQAGQPVTRGTLQATFRYTPFDELVRLGLQPETEERAREIGQIGTGMLVVSRLVPGGPAEDKLAVGDIVVAVDGTELTEFVALEAILDERVGEEVTVVIERGGESLAIEVEVGDLHQVSPSEYLEVGRAVLHDLSYQTARNANREVQGPYLAVAGHMFSAGGVPDSTVLTEIDGVLVPDLDTLEEQLQSKAHGQRMRVRFQMVGDPRHSYESVVTMDRLWYAMRRCKRDDERGTWPCTDAPPPPDATPEPPPQAALLLDDGERVAKRVAPSLVLVDFDIPHPTAGVKDFNYVGAGTVLDAEQGLVLVDRDTVPVALGDLTLTFGGTVRVPGRLRFLHPLHNFAIIQYDPALLGEMPVESIRWARNADVSEGDKLWVVGRDGAHELQAVRTRVDEVSAGWFGLSRTPRFRDSNVEVIRVEDAPGTLGGVLVNRKGEAIALWASFLDQSSGDRGYFGLPSSFIRPVTDALARGEVPEVYGLGADLAGTALVEARDRGLPDSWVTVLQQKDPERREVLQIYRVHGESPAFGVLRDTDLLLAIDGEPVTRMDEIEQRLGPEPLDLEILRDGKTMNVEVQPQGLTGNGVDRVVSWAGLIAHEPHFEVGAQRGIVADGIYVAWLWYGSPASRYGIRPTRRIIAVDGVPTPDLDAFLAAVEGRADRSPVRLEMEVLDGARRVHTLKLDDRFWPTQVLELRDGQWNRSGTLGAEP